MPDDVNKPDTKVVLAGGAHKWLVGIGAALVILAVAVGAAGRAAGNTVDKVGTTSTTKSWPSDTQITALLSSGAVLILTGFLWTRITAIKLPGGAEIDLTSDEQTKAADKIGAALAGTDDAAHVAAETQKAVSALRRTKAQIGTSELTDTEIEAVVQDTVNPP